MEKKKKEKVIENKEEEFTKEEYGMSYKKLLLFGWDIERISSHTKKSNKFIKECLTLVGYSI